MSSSFLDGLGPDDVVVFAGAHPDDETVVGALLACCADRCREVVVVSLTRGESGHNLARADLTQTLAQVREKEFNAAVRALGCTPVMFDYVNGVSRAHPQGLAVLEPHELAVKRWRAAGRQEPDAIRARWTEQTGDPVETLLALFRDKHPSVVITFELKRGFSGHPEHVAMARVTLEAVRAYNRSAGAPAALYCVYPPSESVEGAERISGDDLNRAGRKDYLAMADACKSLYESQFGPRGSETSARYIAQQPKEWPLLRVDTG